MAEPEVSVQIRHIPHRVHSILRGRARAEGKSLQEYLLGVLEAQAAQPTVREVLERAGRRSGSRITIEDTVAILREDRDSR